VSGYEVGDEVRVFDVNGKRVGQPEGGWAGEVVKAGPKLIHVRYGGAHPGSTDTFRRETGARNDAYEHRYVMTLDEVERAERGKAAMAVLRERRISLGHGHRLTLAQAEALAEVVKGWED
jgi:hypothetical protein